MKNKYDIIYSIGHDCACSMYLQRHNLRICSGPLDWITGIPAPARFDLLINEFPDFLNLGDMEFIQKNPNIFNDDRCDYYKNKRTGFLFYHDFPIGIPISESIPNVAEKYARRIRRFYDNIKNKNRVLLVWFSHYHHTTDEQWRQFSQRLCDKMNKNIDILVIEHRNNQTMPVMQHISNNITRYYLHTIAYDKNGNITTLGNEKLCDSIFKKIAIRITPKNKVKYIYKNTMLYGICKFLPIKSLRHKWRNRLKADIQKLF